MPAGFPCPNPTCLHIFPAEAIKGAAVAAVPALRLDLRLPSADASNSDPDGAAASASQGKGRAAAASGGTATRRPARGAARRACGCGSAGDSRAAPDGSSSGP